jgi:protein TonB
MKDRSLLLSLALASVFHGALLFVSLPSYGKTPPYILPSVEVNLIEAAPSQGAGSPAPPPPAQKVIRVQSSEAAKVAPRVQPVVQPQPVKPEVVPAPQPTPVEPEPIETAFVQEPKITAPTTADAVESASGMTGSFEAEGIAPSATGASSGGGAGDSSDGSSFGSGGVQNSGGGTVIDKMPAYAYNPKPKYPSEARRAGQEGTAILRVEVLFSGKVNKIVLEKSTGFELLDKEAVEAVRNWKFSPARKGTRSVTAWVRIPIEFSLKERP